MKAILLARDQRQLDDLREAAATGAVRVVRGQAGDPGGALSDFVAGDAADLLVVDGGAAPQAHLERLAAITQAQPRMSVLLLCDHPDAETLLAAMRAGVREVLPSRARTEELRGALLRLGQRRDGDGSGRARVVAFVACKGGSGSSFLSTNVAWLLAKEHGQRVVLLDMDLQYGDAACFVTDKPGKSNVADLARQSERLDGRLLSASVTQVAPGFDLIPAPEDPEGGLGVTPAQVERLLEEVSRHYDFVVLDVDRALDPLSMKALDQADAIYLVMENMVPFVRNARRLVRILRSLQYPESKLHVVVNRYRGNDGVDVGKLVKAVGLRADHVIPDSLQEVTEAVNLGVPLGSLHPHNTVTKAMRKLASELVGKPVHPAGGWIERLVGKSRAREQS